MPPLAERREDILPLARALPRDGLSARPPMPRARCTRYRWPGNVRELQNAIRRACLLADRSHASDVRRAQPARWHATARREEPELDRATVEQALARAHGVVAHAARDLGLSRQALYRRMEKLGLKSSEAPRPQPAVRWHWSLAGRVSAALALTAALAATTAVVAARWLPPGPAALAGMLVCAAGLPVARPPDRAPVGARGARGGRRHHEPARPRLQRQCRRRGRRRPVRPHACLQLPRRGAAARAPGPATSANCCSTR